MRIPTFAPAMAAAVLAAAAPSFSQAQDARSAPESADAILAAYQDPTPPAKGARAEESRDFVAEPMGPAAPAMRRNPPARLRRERPVEAPDAASLPESPAATIADPSLIFE